MFLGDLSIMNVNIEELSVSDKLFLLYCLTIKTEKEQLAKSKFNDLSINDLHVIHIISLKENITSSQIANLLSFSRAALSKTMDKLEKLNYIKRVPNSKDRRSYLIKLTKKGRLLRRLHNSQYIKYTESLIKDLNLEEKEKLNYSLNKVINHVYWKHSNNTL